MRFITTMVLTVTLLAACQTVEVAEPVTEVTPPPVQQEVVCPRGTVTMDYILSAWSEFELEWSEMGVYNSRVMMEWYNSFEPITHWESEMGYYVENPDNGYVALVLELMSRPECVVYIGPAPADTILQWMHQAIEMDNGV